MQAYFNPQSGFCKITYPYSTTHFMNARCSILSRQIGLPNSQQHYILKAHFLHLLAVNYSTVCIKR